MTDNHDPPSKGHDDDAAFWQHIGEQTRLAPLASSQRDVLRARATAAFARGAPSPWPRRFATIAVVALAVVFLLWAMWQVSAAP